MVVTINVSITAANSSKLSKQLFTSHFIIKDTDDRSIFYTYKKRKKYIQEVNPSKYITQSEKQTK